MVERNPADRVVHIVVANDRLFVIGREGRVFVASRGYDSWTEITDLPPLDTTPAPGPRAA
jgi:hypothetical protein